MVKNGIPKSLKDIEGLPYELEGCSRKEVYKKGSPNRRVVQTRDEADYMVITETCFFKKSDKKYSIDIWFVHYLKGKSTDHGDLRLYHQKTYTGISYDFKKDKNTKQIFTAKEIHIYDNKTSGVCTTFKQ